MCIRDRSSFWAHQELKLESLLVAGLAADFLIAIISAAGFSVASPRFFRPFRGFFLVLRHRALQHTVSAALRTIPKETLDAARIDGASELKIFWKIIIPYLEQTILVIWTIITLLVLKVFDIIYAMTNGQWQTEVLANLMYDWMFRGGGDTGRGSVLAFCILIGVIPILAWNLYKHRQDQKV